MPSANQINRAGKIVRKFLAEDAYTADEARQAVDLMYAWRATFQAPLQAANMGLRSMVRTEGCRVEVSQRLKRMPTILDKLLREPTLALSRMQDIGGCRAVLDSIEEIRRVEARLKRNRPVLRVSDYVATPRASGYRGVHVVVSYHGQAIEVQLRTQVMHEWAYTVERISGRIGQNLKGDGEHTIQKWLAAASEAMALEEAGLTVDASLVALIGHLRRLAEPDLAAGRKRS